MQRNGSRTSMEGTLYFNDKFTLSIKIMWPDKYRALNSIRMQSTANRNSKVSFFGRRAYDEDADKLLAKFCWISGYQYATMSLIIELLCPRQEGWATDLWNCWLGSVTGGGGFIPKIATVAQKANWVSWKWLMRLCYWQQELVRRGEAKSRKGVNPKWI